MEFLPLPPDTIVPPDEVDHRATSTLPGTPEVAADGSAHYRMPLWVPPGRAGMQPSLTLEYNSRRGNGALGVGWSLVAHSEIHRCRHTHAIDGLANAVSFSPTDALCLDGERLIQVSGRDNGREIQPESFYKTERDSFARIQIRVAQDNAPWELVSQEKNGRILTFGGDEDHVRRADPAVNTTTAVRWLLRKVEDRYGNTMEFDYVAGGALPSAIRYTGSVSDPSLAPTRSVKFFYKQRSDVEVSGALGYSEVTQLLEHIETWAPDDKGVQHKLRTYQFVYKQPSITGRSLLTSVAAEDENGIYLPSTDFDWELGEWGFDLVDTGVSNLTDDPNYPGFSVADLNGDGLSDVIYVGKGSTSQLTYQISLSTGDTLAPPIDTDMRPRIGINESYVPPVPFLDVGAAAGLLMVGTDPTDRTNDPRPAHCAYTMVPLAGNWNHPLPRIETCVQPYYAQVWPIDVDGDGLADLFSGWGTSPTGGAVFHFQLRHNAGGTSFDAPVDIQGGQFNGTPRAYGVMMDLRGADLDGDGRQELITCDDQSQGQPVSVLEGTTLSSSNLLKCPDPAKRWGHLYADFNGDGMDDIFYPTDNSNTTKLGMTAVLNLGSQVAPRTSKLDDNELHAGVRIIDYNLDGRPDVMGTRSFVFGQSTSDVPGLAVYLSSIEPTKREVRFTRKYTAPGPSQHDIQLQLTTSDPELIEVGDINGDGLQDLIVFEKGTFQILKRMGKRPDLMTRVVDGVGSEVGFSYAPISNHAVYTPSRDCKYPLRCLNAGLWVVSQQFVSSALHPGARAFFDHHYEAAVEDVRGRKKSAIPSESHRNISPGALR